jgi:hypothetical protein
MNDDVRRVLMGFTNLDHNEQVEVIGHISTYLKMSQQAKDAFEQNLIYVSAIKMAIGPLTDPCPCCGKD